MEALPKEWRWSNGIPYEKSPLKPPKVIEEPVFEDETPLEISICHTFGVGDTTFSRNEGSNRREETYSKMAEREMSNKVNQNPFLMNANYVNDLMTQDKYMKPVNTTFETVKK